MKVNVSKKIKGATGYEVSYSTKSNFKKKFTKVKNVKKLKFTFKRANKKQKYYVRVRSYKKVGKKYYYSKYTKKVRI